MCELPLDVGYQCSSPVVPGCTLGGRSGVAGERGPYLHGNLRSPTEQVGTMPKCCVGGERWTAFLTKCGFCSCRAQSHPHVCTLGLGLF